MQSIKRLFERYEKWLPIFLGLMFLLITLPGISWGVPDLWHPDEMIYRVLKALDGQLAFDEVSFNHPSLSKWVMYGIGKLLGSLGYPKGTIILAARFTSALLGSLTIVITYWITRQVGGGIAAASLSALFLISNSEFGLNAHWAHNDLYVTFFVCLSVYGLVQYSLLPRRLWLYFSFFSAGLAASSKYNGGVIFVVSVLIYLFDQRRVIRKDLLRIIETLFIGGILTILGYGIGTPKSILWMAFYVKRVIPALQNHSLFGRGPESKIGLLIQWESFQISLGTLTFIWVLAAVVYVVVLLIKKFYSTRDLKPQYTALLAIVLSVLVLDLPFLFSYNIQERFFLPILPLLAVLASFFAQDMLVYVRLKRSPIYANLIIISIALVILFSFLRVLSVSLLLTNDSRIIASDYVSKLPAGESIEYTLYPPTIPRDNFSSAHNYPLILVKFPGIEIPAGKYYDFNVGEQGIEERQPEYLVVDSFTVDRFEDPYICDLHRLDCEFFTRLNDGKTNYQKIAEFMYKLPGYLPNPRISFVNPDIFVYERMSD